MAGKAYDVEEQMDALGDIALTCNLKIGTFHEERILREVVLINAKARNAWNIQSRSKKEVGVIMFYFLAFFGVKKRKGKNDLLH